MTPVRAVAVVLFVLLLPILAFVLVGHHLRGAGFVALEMGLTWVCTTLVIFLREKQHL